MYNEIPLNHSPSSQVLISDTTPEAGQILTASHTLADGLGAISYTWQAIGGTVTTTGDTYTVTADDLGKLLSLPRVTASYIDQLGKVETVYSALTAAVANIDAPALVVVSISPLTSTPEKHTALGFLYYVGNIGPSVTGDTADLASVIYLDGKTAADQIGISLHNSYGANEFFDTQSVLGTVNTDNLALGEHTVWIEVDVGNAIAESNETNNWASFNFTVKAPPIEKPIAGIFQEQGYYSAFADLSKAAYHLASNEDMGLDRNFVKPYADGAFGRVQQNWHILTPTDLSGEASGDYLWQSTAGQQFEISNESIYTLKEYQDEVDHTFDFGPSSWTLEADGIYHGNNAAAFAVRCEDVVVISFRGTNDNDSAFIPSVAGSPDVQDWGHLNAHYGELLKFVNKMDDYVSTNNIKKVYVTGA